MGGRLSPIIANIFMEDLESKVLCSAAVIPKLYLRYVDDILIVWNLAKGDYTVFLALLNGQNPQIVLTEESEVNGTLPFLDLSITRPEFLDSGEQSRPVQLAIYRKPTHSDRYLNFKSSHAPSLKREVVRGQWLRANRLLKEFPRNLQIELDHLRSTFCNRHNGYPHQTVECWFMQFRKEIRRFPQRLQVRSRLFLDEFFMDARNQQFRWPTAAKWLEREERIRLNNEAVSLDNGAVDIPETTNALDGTQISLLNGESVAMACENTQDTVPFTDNPAAESEFQGEVPSRKPVLIVPFVQGTSQKLQRVARQHGVQLWHTYPGRLFDQFTHYSDKIHPSKCRNMVYCATCSCEAQYVGETTRNLRIRLAEHLGKSSNSALSDHL